jgi:adenylate kinase family enzyme
VELGPRISVIGPSGSGKSWTASRIGERLGLPHTELDAIRHGPNWTETPDDEFRRIVRERTSGERWVVDGNYTVIVRQIIWDRATDVVWLDYPRSTVMRQVIWRSLRRAALRKELWNGNRERFRNWVQPWHPIRWAWATVNPNKVRDAEWIERHPHITVTRLRSPAAARGFVAGL